MSVRIARNSGFCFGVKRAINLALDAAKNHDSIITLGPIIHNPQMVQKLASEGIMSVDDTKEINNRPTIIRSHGVKKETLLELQDFGIEIINATCPYVSKAQEQAQILSKEGYQVIIMGDKDHPEVKALRSYLDGEVIIVENASELPAKKFGKIGIICQTTRNITDLENLVQKLISQSHEIRVINTICNATSVRQESTVELAKQSEVMIVIGGKNSSNTKMLAKISKNFVETYHIETEREIECKWFKDKVNIGITAGASTPDWIIVEVHNKIIKCMGNIDKKVDNIEDIPGFKEDE
ncbi:MAG: 4-hydroxy-3-methylbut-2-enyl diphosphate reductase [Candidatus Cloacimonetes bacterium]|nr:4-hydroxy-3-methylbut-2-enyl diphosphate reductase [Candidatus Cloacimonadota bacterium]MCF7814430.1 4-hydroxy-3-methylbut-2-enyl diphosphate reductase [Candidatus Cloacimonadota bacterium]MCF7869008.1 4-hydroxy-3-methylbut-2-enyl diphosphate reductase [Candidatus Cloacimonadota bacterium]MCF7884414.1 4-hydroxy-3-methylbut-2-enyl diphosphate reductase [Candidatus Cloacimonadota bacterium]